MDFVLLIIFLFLMIVASIVVLSLILLEKIGYRKGSAVLTAILIVFAAYTIISTYNYRQELKEANEPILKVPERIKQVKIGIENDLKGENVNLSFDVIFQNNSDKDIRVKGFFWIPPSNDWLRHYKVTKPKGQEKERKENIRIPETPFNVENLLTVERDGGIESFEPTLPIHIPEYIKENEVYYLDFGINTLAGDNYIVKDIPLKIN